MKWAEWPAAVFAGPESTKLYRSSNQNAVLSTLAEERRGGGGSGGDS